MKRKYLSRTKQKSNMTTTSDAFRGRWQSYAPRINSIMNSPEMYANKGQTYAHNNAVYVSFFTPYPKIPSVSGMYSSLPVNYWAGQQTFSNPVANPWPGKFY